MPSQARTTAVVDKGLRDVTQETSCVQEVAKIEDPGLDRLQQAAWQDASQTPPALTESASPDLQQAVRLVNPDKAIMQFRSLAGASNSAEVTALVHLPSGCRPFSTATWNAAGTHVAVLCDSVTGGSMTVLACVVRVLDGAVQKIQLEQFPPGSPRPLSFVLPIVWAHCLSAVAEMRARSR